MTNRQTQRQGSDSMETITIQVSEATNTQLDWLVASLTYCDEHDKKRVFLHHTGYEFARQTVRIANQETCEVHMSFEWSPTTNPAQMWQIIDRQGIGVRLDRHRVFEPGEKVERWYASKPFDTIPDTEWTEYGTTGLIAAARCYIVSELGDTAEIPIELVESTPLESQGFNLGDDETPDPAPGQ